MIDDYNQVLNEARLSAISTCIYLASIKNNPQAIEYKLLFLDDIFIGLDMGNRLPILKMRLCQNADTAFFMRKAQRLSSAGFVITQSFRIFRHKVFRYGKVTFSSLHSQPNRSFSQKMMKT